MSPLGFINMCPCPIPPSGLIAPTDRVRLQGESLPISFCWTQTPGNESRTHSALLQFFRTATCTVRRRAVVGVNVVGVDLASDQQQDALIVELHPGAASFPSPGEGGREQESGSWRHLQVWR